MRELKNNEIGQTSGGVPFVIVPGIIAAVNAVNTAYRVYKVGKTVAAIGAGAVAGAGAVNVAIGVEEGMNE